MPKPAKVVSGANFPDALRCKILQKNHFCRSGFPLVSSRSRCVRASGIVFLVTFVLVKHLFAPPLSISLESLVCCAVPALAQIPPQSHPLACPCSLQILPSSKNEEIPCRYWVIT